MVVTFSFLSHAGGRRARLSACVLAVLAAAWLWAPADLLASNIAMSGGDGWSSTRPVETFQWWTPYNPWADSSSGLTPGTASLQGYVYLDVNRNGAYNPSKDTLIDDARVWLVRTDGPGLAIAASDQVGTYGQSGYYSFDKLPQGSIA